MSEKLALNCGAGQRKFESINGARWVNIDINPKWEPDVVADWNKLDFANDSVDIVVSCHSIEHVGCGEADGFVREAHRVLKPYGSLIVIVPDMRALAERWLTGQMDEQLYMTAIYGAYMGDEADRHKWGWSRQGIIDYLKRRVGVSWHDAHTFNNRPVLGAQLPADWWMTSIECVK